MKLSIVIIGRNEEAAIAKCVGAAQNAARQIGGDEIIFVDSASTDKTVKIVEALGVRAVRLDESVRLSPSAGRYAGTQSATGDLILFVDADTLVYEDFLPEAIARFEADPLLAGVNGRIDDLDESGELLDDVEERRETVFETTWLRGPCCLYRRLALEDAGTFNPYLAVEEEAELGLRIVRRGWKLEQIPVPMGCHTRCYHLQSLSSVFAAFRRDIAVGRLGEMTRTAAYAFRNGNGLRFCWLRFKTTILFASWLLLGLLCAVLPLPVNPNWPFAAISLIGFASVALKKRSITRALAFVPGKLFVIIDLVAGMNKLRIRDAADFFAAGREPRNAR